MAICGGTEKLGATENAALGAAAGAALGMAR